MITVNELMSKKVISVSPETFLIEATNSLLDYNFNGLPVVDRDNVLVGILTEYDLVLKGSYVHLPTFIKLFSQFELYKKDQSLIKDDLKKIFEMKVSDVMNTDPLFLNEGASLEDTFKAFSEHHKVNPIPIVDKDKKVIGVVSRYDLNKLFHAPELSQEKNITQRDIDRDINLFLNSFGNRFILVSKTRTHLWLIVSILFSAVGYIIAWAFILRFE